MLLMVPEDAGAAMAESVPPTSIASAGIEPIALEAEELDTHADDLSDGESQVCRFLVMASN